MIVAPERQRHGAHGNEYGVQSVEPTRRERGGEGGGVRDGEDVEDVGVDGVQLDQGGELGCALQAANDLHAVRRVVPHCILHQLRHLRPASLCWEGRAQAANPKP